MSLQVWLPLTKDLRNQGLSNVSVTNNGATFNSTGKLGGCYQFNASGYLKETSFDWSNFNTSEFSLCCWYKEPSPVASGNSQMICIGTNSGWNNIRIGLLRRTSSGYPMFSVSDGSNNVNYNFTASSFSLDTWNHIVCTYNNGTMKMYLNGELHKTYTTTIVPVLNSSQHLGIGAASNGAEPLTGYLNDVRIYDHCLSPKEVKEISKGLVLHYPLNNNGFGQENLIKDYMYDNLPWTNGGIIKKNLLYKDKKCMQINVGGLYNNTSSGTTTLFPDIDFESNTQYTLSWKWRDDLRTDGKNTNYYLRFKYTDGTWTNVISGNDPQDQWTYHTMTSTAGKTVAAICTTYGYGTDKFLLTDLKLEKGVIATIQNPIEYNLLYDKNYYRESDGSSWVRIFHHNNPASTLFSSSDTFSTGVYKNTDAWYDFEPIMAKLPYYEFMVKQKTTSDATETKYRWIQYKNPLDATWYDVEPSQVKRITTSEYTNLSYAGGVYLRNGSARLTIANTSNGNWYGALGCWTAYQGGIPGFPSVVVTTGFIDLYVRIPDQGIEFDTSGFGNNINKVNTIHSITDTKRYKTSTQFNGTEVLTTVSPGGEILTLSCWAKTSKNKATSQFIVADSISKLCCTLYSNSFISYFGGNSGYDTGSRCTLGSEYKENDWNHFVAVKTGEGTRDCYCNGIKLTPTTNDWWSTASGFHIGNRSSTGGNTPFYGQISDVRAYATALSAEDVAELYAAGHS